MCLSSHTAHGAQETEAPRPGGDAGGFRRRFAVSGIRGSCAWRRCGVAWLCSSAWIRRGGPRWGHSVNLWCGSCRSAGPHEALPRRLCAPRVGRHPYARARRRGGRRRLLGNAAYSLERLARQGTTSGLATVRFKSKNAIQPLCERIQAFVGAEGFGCVLRGIHAEGPVVATLGGLPDSSEMAASGIGDFENILAKIGPSLKIMTISPSCDAPSNFLRMQALVRRDVRVSLGHDKNCSEMQIINALRVGNGATGNPPRQRFHVTHSFNVQSFHHRSPGLANFALCKFFPFTCQSTQILPAYCRNHCRLQACQPHAIHFACRATSFGCVRDHRCNFGAYARKARQILELKNRTGVERCHDCVHTRGYSVWKLHFAAGILAAACVQPGSIVGRCLHNVRNDTSRSRWNFERCWRD